MKASHYVLNETEHTELAVAKQVPDPADPKKRIEQPAPLRLVNLDDVDVDTRGDALRIAGVDKYTSGIAYGELIAPWREHQTGSLVVRHVTSSGYNVCVFDVDVDGDQLARPAPPKPSAEALELEQQRQKQAAADEAKRKAAETSSSSSSSSTSTPATPANDNQVPDPRPTPKS